LENYTIISQLGEGSFGLIFKVYNNETKINYAMKKIIANNIHSLEVYQREFEIVHENSHPNILDIHGVCMRCLDTTTYVLYVLMDIAEKDWEAEINERAKIKKYYLEKELISILKQIVSALCFLQKEKNVAHRDIKPENILVFKNNIYKIADFGEAKKSNINKFRTLRGTEFYMSPILYKNLKIKNDYVKHNPYKSDVFSLGYCLVCATALDFDIIDNIRGKNESEIREVFNKAFPSIYSNKFVELIFKMIEQDERKRVDFIHLKQILDKEF
jgi:serine/threonine protein kinase